ncbi:MAG: anti-sigma factor antagonist [Candidatus Omnitrophica bacterium]|nr:anti-sigma factor antagonist [Candidatus Omnitrophota bacterium]
MKINIRYKDTAVILDLEGNIDINSSEFVETVGWALINKSKDILCNCEGINLIDYVGISIIAVAYKNVLNHKGRLKLYAVPTHVQRLFSVVGLDRVFDYYETESEALKSFAEESIFSEIIDKQLRRRFKRVPLNGDIHYKQKFSPVNTFYTGKIINLSAIGVFLISDKLFSIGEILSTKLHLLPEPGIVEIDAKVVWVADQEIQPLESPAMGLEFYNIEAHQQERIIQFVEKNLASTDID